VIFCAPAFLYLFGFHRNFRLPFEANAIRRYGNSARGVIADLQGDRNHRGQVDVFCRASNLNAVEISSSGLDATIANPGSERSGEY
jgi:hypothetical protein